MSDAGPSGHLLRTLAAVAPTARVVVVACGTGIHAEPLARLGFDVWACDPEPAHVGAARRRLAEVVGEAEAERRVTRASTDALGYPDAYADWVVLDDGRATDSALAEVARVLAPGGWLWTEAAAPDALLEAAETVGLTLSEAPAPEPGRTRAHVILRRVGGVG